MTCESLRNYFPSRHTPFQPRFYSTDSWKRNTDHKLYRNIQAAKKGPNGSGGLDSGLAGDMEDGTVSVDGSYSAYT